MVINSVSLAVYDVIMTHEDCTRSQIELVNSEHLELPPKSPVQIRAFMQSSKKLTLIIIFSKKNYKI